MDEESEYSWGSSNDGESWDVWQNDSGFSVYETSDPYVAEDFAYNGDLSDESYYSADLQTYNYEGGIQYEPDTPADFESYGYYSDYQTPYDYELNGGFTTVSYDDTASRYQSDIEQVQNTEAIDFDYSLPESAVRVDNRVQNTEAIEFDYSLPESAVQVDNRVRYATAQAAEDITGGTATRSITSDTTVENYTAATVGSTYSSVQDPNTGQWSIVSTNSQGQSEVVATGLSQYNANLLVRQNNTNPPGAGTSYQNAIAPTLSQATAGPNASYAQRMADAAASTLQLAQQQSTVSAQRNQGGTGAKLGDWRVRLRLAPHATYLYKDNTPDGQGQPGGILAPLRATDGVIFPYMPTIATNYSADYSPYDLTHSNYRGYFYKGSRVGEVTLTADFTAQDSAEADYLLAVITFFKACTKMFYGQDQHRGSPPPLVFLSGLGGYQFAEHACAISNFAYNLPNDVDYIRARGRQTTTGGQMMWRRSLSYTQSGFDLSAIWARLTGSAQSVGIGFGSNNAQLLMNGAMNIPPAPPNLGLTDATYVPTKMTITLTLLPMMSRQQVSKQFSLQKFANGNLIKGGFW